MGSGACIDKDLQEETPTEADLGTRGSGPQSAAWHSATHGIQGGRWWRPSARGGRLDLCLGKRPLKTGFPEARFTT